MIKTIKLLSNLWMTGLLCSVIIYAGSLNADETGNIEQFPPRRMYCTNPVSAVLSVYDLSSAYAYPVPYKPRSDVNHTGITFTNLSSLAVIKIYTFSGRLVKELYEHDGDSIYTWDGRAGGKYIPSGVYIYVIKNAVAEKKGKLVVIK